MKRFQSLQGRLLLLLGGVLFGTLLIIGMSVFVLVSSAERDLWLGRQTEAGRNAATQASNYIDLARVGLQFIAQIDGDSARLDDILNTSVARNPGYLEFIVVNQQGEVVSSASAGETVLASVFTIAQSNWFESALGASADDVFLGEVQVSPQNVPYIIISASTRSGGVAALRLSLSVLGEIVSELRFGTTGTTYVVQRSGFIAAHPDPAVTQSVVNLVGREELETALQNPGTGWTGSYVNFEGESVIGTSSVVPNTNLVVITEVTQSEASANSRSALLVLGGITFLFWVGAILLTTASIRRLVFLPLRRLQEGANEVEQGNLQYQIEVSRQDEIGQLASAFNKMVDAIQQRETDLRENAESLRIATAKAKEAARVKGEFLANVSHELRTPLNAIIGFSDMLLAGMSGPLNDKQQHKLARLKENGARLLALINDLLDLTRIEAGRIEMVEKAFAPRALAERMAAQMESLAVESKLQFETFISPDVPATLLGDEKRVEQVIVNLLSNAFKFTKEGSITLNIDANHAEQNWVLSVTDTGIGIPPHAVNIIFEEFRQLDGSYSRAYKGSGLGLAITRNLVRVMGGKISVKSEVESGSTFTVVMPMIIPETTNLTVLEAVAS